MEFSGTQQVGHITAAFKESVLVFEQYGIDYSTGSKRGLWEACEMAEAPLNKVLAELRAQAEHSSKAALVPEPPLQGLIDRVLQRHHPFTRTQIRVIQGHLDRFAVDRGVSHPSVTRLRTTYERFSNLFLDHLAFEESRVFPMLLEAEAAYRSSGVLPVPKAGGDVFQNPIHRVLSEHRMMSLDFAEVKTLLADHPVAQDLQAAIRALEEDNRTHVQLESGEILRRAIRMGLLV